MNIFRFLNLFFRKFLIFSLINCSAISLSCFEMKTTSENSNLISSSDVSAIEYGVGNLHFLLDPKTHEAQFLRSTGSSVVIPDSIEYKGKSYSVTSIADKAFINRIDLVSVSIPKSVKLIGKQAFYGCWKLGEIIIPASVEEIRDDAFWNCSAPSTIEILGNKLKSIGSNAFADCYSAKIINIPESVVSIGENAFKNCKSLVSLQISGNFDLHKFDNSGIILKKDNNKNYTGSFSIEGASVDGVLICQNSTTMNCFCNSGKEAIAIDLVVNKWGGML